MCVCVCVCVCVCSAVSEIPTTTSEEMFCRILTGLKILLKTAVRSLTCANLPVGTRAGHRVFLSPEGPDAESSQHPETRGYGRMQKGDVEPAVCWSQ